MQNYVDTKAVRNESNQISEGDTDHVKRNRNQGRAERAVPVRQLQELRSALVGEKDPGGVGKGDVGSADVAESSMLILSGDLDKLVGFGDVRSYLGEDACTIRRNNREFLLQFPTPGAARRCLANVAAEVSTTPGTPIPGKPFFKDGKHRRVFLRFQTPGKPPLLSIPSSSQAPEPVHGALQYSGSKQSEKASANAQAQQNKASVEMQPWASVPLETQQNERLLETGPVGLPPEAPPTGRKFLSSESIGYEHELGVDEQSWGDQLLVQEVLALVAKTAQWRREAQEKSRMVEHLTQREEMLRRALEETHSRLMLYETAVLVASQEPADFPAVMTPKQSELPDETSRKRKKSVSAPAAHKSPEADNQTGSKNEPGPTGWSENKPRAAEAETFDLNATGLGGDITSPATPLDWSEEPTHHQGSFNTTGSGKSSPSNRSGRSRHRRGHRRGQQLGGVTKGTGLGSKRVEAPPRGSAWDEAVSGSSEAADLRMSGNSSAGGFWDEGTAGPFKRTHGAPPNRGVPQQNPQWDGRSSASSVGDGGMATPPLQDGEWEWPVTPGKKALPSPKKQVATGTSTARSSDRLNVTGTPGVGHKAGGGLLPVPTGWGGLNDGLSDGVKRLEPGEKAPVGVKSPGGGAKSGRGSDSRARKKSGGYYMDGDYAGAPREREAPEGRWPRGMVT